jgi:hypothetical protein
MENYILVLSTLKEQVFNQEDNLKEGVDIDNILGNINFEEFMSSDIFKQYVSEHTKKNITRLTNSRAYSDYYGYFLKNLNSMDIDSKLEILYTRFQNREKYIKTTFMLNAIEKIKQEYNYLLEFNGDALIEIFEIIVEHFKNPLEEKHVKSCLKSIITNSGQNFDAILFHDHGITNTKKGFSIYKSKTLNSKIKEIIQNHKNI